MERQGDFSDFKVRFLANLCHNCAECLDACQYAPPHEFAVDLPKTLEQIRLESYRHYAWPKPLAKLFNRNGLVAAIAFAAALFFFWHPAAADDFYGVISHRTMVAIFGAVSIFVIFALAMGLRRFWRESAGEFDLGALRQSSADVLRLRYLGGARRWFHHFTFYGFGLCFAATSVAAFYHYALGWIAPYGYFSLPVVLGSAGGVGLLIGPAGLFWVRRREGRDVAFLVLLFVTSATGLLLLALRETAAMPVLLEIHLAVVLALLITLPYGKFVHGIYRWAALVRYSGIK